METNTFVFLWSKIFDLIEKDLINEFYRTRFNRFLATYVYTCFMTCFHLCLILSYDRSLTWLMGLYGKQRTVFLLQTVPCVGSSTNYVLQNPTLVSIADVV